MVHSTPDTVAPPELASETFKLTAPPATALPEFKETAAVCARRGLAASPASMQANRKALLSDLREAYEKFMKSFWARCNHKTPPDDRLKMYEYAVELTKNCGHTCSVRVATRVQCALQDRNTKGGSTR